jgi:hypothetical protein
VNAQLRPYEFSLDSFIASPSCKTYKNMAKYNPHFQNLYEKLTDPVNLMRMEIAASVGRPALEGVLELLNSTECDEYFADDYNYKKRAVGRAIAHLLSFLGWERTNFKYINVENRFKTGMCYKRSKEPKYKLIPQVKISEHLNQMV